MLKKLFFITVFTAGMFSLSFAQENNFKKFIGAWKGTLEVQGQSYTAIFIFKEKDGKLTGIAESPELGGGSVALDNIIIKENKIQLDIPSMRSGFEGVYKEEKKAIEGSYIMGEEGLPLILEKDVNAPVKEEKKFTSIWEGTMDFKGTSISIVLKIYTNADDTIGGLIDSPTQGTSDIPAGQVTLTDDALNFDMPSVGAEYKGKLDKTTMTVKGTFTQRGNELPLDLKKVDKPAQQ